MISKILPIKTVSETNQREHWAARHRRRKKQRRNTYLLLCQERQERAEAFTIRLTRIAPRKLDSDNLLSSMKAVRDGVADWLGMDDADPSLAFEYAQTKGEPKQYAVRVEIVPWQISHPWPGEGNEQASR